MSYDDTWAWCCLFFWVYLTKVSSCWCIGIIDWYNWRHCILNNLCYICYYCWWCSWSCSCCLDLCICFVLWCCCISCSTAFSYLGNFRGCISCISCKSVIAYSKSSCKYCCHACYCNYLFAYAVLLFARSYRLLILIIAALWWVVCSRIVTGTCWIVRIIVAAIVWTSVIRRAVIVRSISICCLSGIWLIVILWAVAILIILRAIIVSWIIICAIAVIIRRWSIVIVTIGIASIWSILLTASVSITCCVTCLTCSFLWIVQFIIVIVFVHFFRPFPTTMCFL